MFSIKKEMPSEPRADEALKVGGHPLQNSDQAFLFPANSRNVDDTPSRAAMRREGRDFESGCLLEDNFLPRVPAFNSGP